MSGGGIGHYLNFQPLMIVNGAPGSSEGNPLVQNKGSNFSININYDGKDRKKEKKSKSNGSSSSDDGMDLGPAE